MNPFAAFVPTLLVKLGKARPRVTLLQVPAAFTAPRTDHIVTISSDRTKWSPPVTTEIIPCPVFPISKDFEPAFKPADMFTGFRDI